ncbi:helix-turn-helix transcriptional regulator [Streptomyces agglomeratus]|uniref:LuxR C-terminal-related transcriptional regulator n=1 Tax=Streptomyces agglomeratus TaxID=285458 RepID=UPI000854E7BA|nr:LuxR C-terminal-related transcriptional regulator [Streptomyces agglomeratus]OEJ40072.1 helix-turn-helix transcriptional regulator [Streptomyces agglomeratus]OEJ45548.1 helix-turn-helix transcriptional regulator [Streptomyces agglomeratus]
MGEDTDIPAHPHGPRELCEPAVQLYTEALRKGRIARSDLTPAPCLIDMALVRPDPQDAAWLQPVPPSAALAHLLQPITREIHERVRLTTALTETLTPLTAVASDDPNLAITVLEGKPLIQSALAQATSAATREFLTLQPGSTRSPQVLGPALRQALSAIERGISIRHIYQHSARYSPHVRDYLEHFTPGQVQVRTMEQTCDRLIILDREVAFIPATRQRDVALEIRHPALVTYFVQVYEVLWAQATPIAELLPLVSPDTPVTAVQRGIARLLVEGNTDEVVARRMGISVRTCRSHIAKLTQALNASGRTHLGALLVQSGIVDTAGPALPQLGSKNQ